MTRFLHEVFSAVAATRPSAVAVVAGDTTQTYAEVEARANQLAHHLIGLGVGPGSLVAVHLDRCPQLVVAMLGVLKAGAGYVPIDTQTPWRRTAFIVAETRAPVVITSAELADTLTAAGVPTLVADPDWTALHAQPVHAPRRPVTAQDIAYVMYTSGTTGVPNGVLVPHGPLGNYLDWCVTAYRLHEGTGSLVHSSIAFDLTVTTLLAPLLVGQRLILIPQESGLRGLADALRSGTDLTLVKLTPTHLKLLALLLDPQELAGRIRTLVVGGEDLWADTLALFRGPGGPVRIVNEYGPTETVVGCCVYQVTPRDPGTGRVPIGEPIADTRIRIVDAQLRTVPAGVVGEALVSGAGVTAGYLDRPELTAQRFVTGPDGRREYRTGDLVRERPDGGLEYLCRADDQVKIRGVRIEPGEIAGVLRGHPAIAEVAVVIETPPSTAPIPDPRPVAYLVPRPDAPAGLEAALADYCRERLPEFLQPAAFRLVRDLPTTTNGKLDHRALTAGTV